MFYLKITFLVSYFLIIFIVFRVAALRNDFSCSWLSYFMENFFTEATSGCATAEKGKNVKITSNSEASSLLNTSQLPKNEETIRDYFVEQNQETELLNYQDFIEKVEDTKASVWAILVNPPTSITSLKDSGSGLQKEWSRISMNFTENGIRTGSYQCLRDIRLCLIHKITTPSVLLTMPKGSQPKGKVIVHIFKSSSQFKSPILYDWVQSKLHPKMKTVHSLSELIERPARRQNKHNQNSPSMYFVYRAKENSKPPLSISALSVKFTGRIKFYMLKGKDKDREGDNGILAINKFLKYSYGKHNGESFTYSCMELFLKTLHPEVNDIFIASAILLNMACWFEVSLQKGGPLRRLLFYAWGFATSNILLVTIWLPLLKLIYLPQLQPLVEVCLQNLQKFMFTNTAAVLRQDFMELNKHLYIVSSGFVCYGVFLGYLHFKFRNDFSNLSLTGLLQNDINEIRESFNALIENITPNFRIYQFEARIERILFTLSRSDLWLPTESSCEYIKELPTWKFCKQFEYGEVVENIEPNLPSESEDESVPIPPSKTQDTCLKDCLNRPLYHPEYIFKASNCVICLEEYKCGAVLMGLPCGHSFHKKCATDWLFLESSLNKCPVCRWPCNIKKGTKVEIIDTT